MLFFQWSLGGTGYHLVLIKILQVPVPYVSIILYNLCCWCGHYWSHLMVMVRTIIFCIIIGDILLFLINKVHGIDPGRIYHGPSTFYNNQTRYVLFQINDNNNFWHRIVFQNWFGELCKDYLLKACSDSGSRLAVIEYHPWFQIYLWNFIIWWYVMLTYKWVVQ